MSVGWIVALVLYVLGFITVFKLMYALDHPKDKKIRFGAAVVWPLGIIWAMIS